MVTFGFELEVSGGAGRVLQALNDDGLTGHEYLHDYHCDCDECVPDTHGYLFKAQEDSTCDGEFITRIIEFGSDDATRAINGISRALLLAGADCTGRVGNHVHVDQTGMDFPAKLRLARLFVRYQDSLGEIAQAGRRSVRSYNTPQTSTPELWTTFDRPTEVDPYYSSGTPSRYSNGTWLSWKNPTVEFRLWNSTRAAWRIATNVGLSVAMVEAATAGVDCGEHDQRVLEEVIGDFIDARTWGGILRQRFATGGYAEGLAA